MLCLYDSLKEQRESFRLWVLCFDVETEAAVAACGSASLVAIPLAELLAADPAYAKTRTNRSRVEFYFTSTATLVLHCLQREPSAEVMTYLDADMYFFAPPSRVFSEQGGASVGIVPHRFPEYLRGLEKYGRYNVGWVSFRRDYEGLACLDWWRRSCLEWCHDRLEDGKFGDQGYLNEFSARFGGVKELEHPGINAGPWNMDGAAVTRLDGCVMVAGRELLFYHFQGLRELRPGLFEPGLRVYGTRLNAGLRDYVYLPYVRRLAHARVRVLREAGIEPRFTHARLNAGSSLRDRWERFKACWALPFYGRLRGQLIHISKL
jgi:hypothetical protein